MRTKSKISAYILRGAADESRAFAANVSGGDQLACARGTRATTTVAAALSAAPKIKPVATQSFFVFTFMTLELGLVQFPL